ncbi:morphogenic membrane protein MmpA [Streptomyces sp. NPDC058867]
MASHRAPQSLADSGRPVGRAVAVALVAAVLAGVGWICGMVWAVARWSL